MRDLKHCFLGAAVVALLAAQFGCTSYPTGGAPSQVQVESWGRMHQELTARHDELATRAVGMDADNQQLQALLAQQQQQTAQMQQALRQSRRQVSDLKQGIAREQRHQKPATGTASYKASASQLPLVAISDTDVDYDGPSVRIRIDGAQLFASGRANLKSGSNQLLDDLADAVRQEYTGHLVTIEGHTDSDPITRSRWKSNHELSLARAMAVYHALRRRGVPEAQLAVAGFGANSPIASNRTTEGKAKNRRIEVVVQPAPAE